MRTYAMRFDGHDFRDATEEEIRHHADQLSGKTVAHVATVVGATGFGRGRDGRNKGNVGHLVEAFFGIPKNADRVADFVAEGIELKVVPLKKANKGWTVKERTVLGMIDYRTLPEETWKSASVRKKLDKILFVVYEHDPADLRNCRFRRPFLWSPPEDDIPILCADWETVQGYVGALKAHKLTERLARALSPCTKGAGKGQVVDYHPRAVPAKPRAFSLKQSYTKEVVLEPYRKTRSESLVESLDLDDPRRFESATIGRLRPLVGKTLGTIEAELGLDGGDGKGLAATIMKRALGFKNVNSRVKEFDRYGVEVKVLKVEPESLMPWEAVSFPKVSLKELVDTDWEDADLQEQLDRILFIPTLSPEKTTDPRDRILGESFFWSPEPSEWETIASEWTAYRDGVAQGKAQYYVPEGKVRRRNDLLDASGTKIVHMRPHARNSKDTDLDPFDVPVTKQCFWLNKEFVQGLLIGRDDD